MTPEKLKREYLNNKPILRLSSLLEMMNEIDPFFT